MILFMEHFCVLGSRLQSETKSLNLRGKLALGWCGGLVAPLRYCLTSVLPSALMINKVHVQKSLQNKSPPYFEIQNILAGNVVFSFILPTVLAQERKGMQ